MTMSTVPSLASGLSFAASTPARAVFSSSPVDGIDPDLGDRVGILLGHRFDLDTTLRREHPEVLLRGAVERERRVVYLGDVGRLLDPHHLDGVALDVHADDVGRVLAALVAVGRELDATRLAASPTCTCALTTTG